MLVESLCCPSKPQATLPERFSRWIILGLLIDSN
ncbi:hypothetical protein V6Z11_D13G087400 [Gossypium hirsutum]